VKTKEELGVRVGVAGGLKPGVIKGLVERGVDVVIVGSAITKLKPRENNTRYS